MKLSKKYKQKVKKRILNTLASIALVTTTLATMKLADFSMPKIEIKALGDKSENISSKSVTIAEDGAIVCDSIVQGVRDCDLEDGMYTFRVTGEADGVEETKDYLVEFINYYDDVTYSLADGETSKTVTLGDATTEYKMLVVKYHKNLTINSGVTVTAKNVSSLTYKKGMYICVMGELINNGTISMTARGTYNQAGENVYLWKNADSSFEYIPAVGGAGSPAYTGTGNSSAAKCKGTDGIGRETGGGAKGSYRLDGKGTVGAGGDGTSYSGGSGSGAVIYDVTNGSTPKGVDASDIGGAGGNALRYGSGTWVSAALGGTGNTGGTSASNSSTYRNLKGNNGTGGLLIIYSDSIVNKGSITANGVASSYVNLGTSQKLNASGGPSGGGSINIFYNKTISNESSITATGGKYVVGTGLSRYAGGNGGSGTVTLSKVEADLNYNEKSITLNIGQKSRIDKSELKYINLSELQGPVTVGNIEFESLDSSVATVNANGAITGIKAGKTKIKITDTTNDISTYIFVEVVDKVKIDVQEGKDFTVALKQNGTVWSYGLNTSGELGIGNSENQTAPTQIETLSNIKAIATGYSHSLALDRDGNVYAWGAGTNGQLGNGEEINSNIPVKVDGISNIIKIDAYKNMSIALDSNGIVYVWGEGYSTLPMRVVFSEKVIDISGIMMLTENGEVYNVNDTSAKITNLSNIAKISCGAGHYLALNIEGKVYGWETNTYGELATSATGTKSQMIIADDVIDISAGNCTSIIQKEDGTVLVTGNNASGQIGLSSTAKATAFSEITLGEDIQIEQISAGENTHSGLIDTDGFVWHTGLNAYGELGAGNTKNVTTFTKIGETIITIQTADKIYLDLGESITLNCILENTFNLKIDLIDDVQENFEMTLSSTDKLSLNDKIITALAYGSTPVTITHIPTGTVKEIEVSVVMKMESIVQGIRDTDLSDGIYEILIEDEVYKIELYNYYDDVTYTEDAILGHDTADETMLVIKYHGDLTINEGVTLTPKVRKKGMYVCVLGDIHNNGTITMTARGANSEGQNVYLWNNIDDTYEYVPEIGANGSPAYTGKGTSTAAKCEGEDGIGRQTGGGAKGAYRLDGTGTVGAGGNGTSYSGGVGSGAVIYDITNGSVPKGVDASDTGGTGGNALRYGRGTWLSVALGGTGNTGGTSASNNNNYKNLKGNEGTGGLLILYADILYNEGTISSNGVSSSYINLSRSNTLNASGGPSGGGSINIFANFINAQGTMNVDGGKYVVGTAPGKYIGGSGGDGTITINELGSILNYSKKKIELNVQETHTIDTSKITYTKLNEIQTEDLTVGNLKYESLDKNIATVDSNGKITGLAVGKTKIKITDLSNGYSTYIIVTVTKQGLITPQIKEGTAFTCALKANGTVWSFGTNANGELGNNSTVNSNEPIEVLTENGDSLKDIVDIGTGDSSSIAVNKYGEVYTWGVYKYLDDEGTAKTKNRLVATKEATLRNIVKVDSYKNNFYAVDNNGIAYIWGEGYEKPTKIETAVGIEDISGNLILGQDGLVYLVSNPTVAIEYLNNICEVACGEDHNLFLTLDGYVYSLGTNDVGQCRKWNIYYSNNTYYSKDRRIIFK